MVLDMTSGMDLLDDRPAGWLFVYLYVWIGFDLLSSLFSFLPSLAPSCMSSI